MLIRIILIVSSCTEETTSADKPEQVKERSIDHPVVKVKFYVGFKLFLFSLSGLQCQTYSVVCLFLMGGMDICLSFPCFEVSGIDISCSYVLQNALWMLYMASMPCRCFYTWIGETWSHNPPKDCVLIHNFDEYNVNWP